MTSNLSKESIKSPSMVSVGDADPEFTEFDEPFSIAHGRSSRRKVIKRRYDDEFYDLDQKNEMGDNRDDNSMNDNNANTIALNGVNIDEMVDTVVDDDGNDDPDSTDDDEPYTIASENNKSEIKYAVVLEQQTQEGQSRPAQSSVRYKKRNKQVKRQSSNVDQSVLDFEHLTLSDMRRYFHLPITEVSKSWGISTTVFKRICRRLTIKKWPYRKVKSIASAIQSHDMALLSGDITVREKIRSTRHKRKLMHCLRSVLDHPDNEVDIEDDFEVYMLRIERAISRGEEAKEEEIPEVDEEGKTPTVAQFLEAYSATTNNTYSNYQVMKEEQTAGAKARAAASLSTSRGGFVNGREGLEDHAEDNGNLDQGLSLGLTKVKKIGVKWLEDVVARNNKSGCNREHIRRRTIAYFEGPIELAPLIHLDRKAEGSIVNPHMAMLREPDIGFMHKFVNGPSGLLFANQRLQLEQPRSKWLNLSMNLPTDGDANTTDHGPRQTLGAVIPGLNMIVDHDVAVRHPMPIPPIEPTETFIPIVPDVSTLATSVPIVVSGTMKTGDLSTEKDGIVPVPTIETDIIVSSSVSSTLVTAKTTSSSPVITIANASNSSSDSSPSSVQVALPPPNDMIEIKATDDKESPRLAL